MSRLGPMSWSTLSLRASHATWWRALEILSRFGSQFVVIIILARLLTPSDFGLIAILLIFTEVGILVVGGGLRPALVQGRRVGADHEVTVFWVTAVTGLVLALVLYMSARGIATAFQQPALLQLMQAMAWVVPITALATVPDAILAKDLNFKVRAHSQFLASVVAGAVAIALAVSGFGVWSLVWQVLVLNMIRTILFWRYSGRLPRGRFRLSAFVELFRFGGYLMVAGLLDTVIRQGQSLLVGKLFDLRTLGYYTLAYNVQRATTSVMAGTLSGVGLPVFSEIAYRPERLRRALRGSLRIALFVFAPCMVGLAIAARPLIIMVYGAQWAPAAPLLTLFALAGALWPIHVLNLAALNAQGYSKLHFRLAIIKKLILVSLVLLMSPFGALAIATGVLIATVVGVVINCWYSGKFLSYNLFEQLADQRHTVSLCLIAALPAWAILHFFAHNWISTLVAVLVASVLYIGLAVTMKHPAWAPLMQIIQTLVGDSHNRERAKDA